MSVKIRLARRGRRKKPFYHIVVADARSPRDGKFIEQIGSYNPMTSPATIDVDQDKALSWLNKGAQPTDTARAILRFKGVMYKKHLQRGVSKGAMTQEEADQTFADYINAKEAKIAARFEQTLQERIAFNNAVSGTPKKVYVEQEAAAEALEEFQVDQATDEAPVEAAEEAVAEATAEVVEEAPAAEEVTEAPVAEEAPATEEAKEDE